MSRPRSVSPFACSLATTLSFPVAALHAGCTSELALDRGAESESEAEGEPVEGESEVEGGGEGEGEAEGEGECEREADCDDGNVCTDDICDPDHAGADDRGCVRLDNTAACDDGDACTWGDTCTAGSCVPGGDSCGDGICNCGESTADCCDDCSACGDGACDCGEDDTTCSEDCGGRARLWTLLWDGAATRIDVLVVPEHVVEATIDLGARDPRDIAVSPDGARAWASVEGELHVVDATSRSVVASLPLGADLIVVSPDGSRVYLNDSVRSEVVVLDATDLSVAARLSPGGMGVAVRPGGNLVWTGRRCGAHPCIDERSYPGHEVVGSLGPVPALNLDEVVFVPDRPIAYVNSNCGCCGTLFTMDVERLAVARTRPWDGGGGGLALGPDGEFVYAAGHGGCGGENQLVKIAAASDTVVAALPLAATPGQNLALTPDGGRIYVLQGTGLGVVDTESMTLLETIDPFEGDGVPIRFALQHTP